MNKIIEMLTEFGARASDLEARYAEALGDTVHVALDAVASAPSTQLSPGRYLFQLYNLGVNVAWVKMGKYDAVTPVAAATAAPSTPFSDATVVTFKAIVIEGFNDQVAGLMSAGTGDLYITRISR